MVDAFSVNDKKINVKCTLHNKKPLPIYREWLNKIFYGLVVKVLSSETAKLPAASLDFTRKW